MFRSIKVKLTLIVFGILSGMVLLQLVCNYLLAEPYYVARRSALIEKAYEDLSEEVGDQGKMVRIMRQYENKYNIQFLLANQSMVCIYNSRQQEFKNLDTYYRVKANFSFRKNFERFSSKPEAVVMPRENQKNRAKVALYGILQKSDQRYYVMIKSNLQSIQESMKETGNLVLLFNGITLLAGGAIAHFFAKKMTDPIRQMDDVACHVAQMDFSKKADDGGRNDELGRLARNINEMSERIEENIAQLMEENQYRERMEEARKEFIANVSHELKTPLAILSGYAEMLQIQEENIDKDYYCEVIMDEAKKMTSLVNELLNVVRMEKELETIQPRKFNYSLLVEKQVKRQEVLWKQKKIKGQVEIEKDLYVYGNPDYLTIILSNYLSNAISHTEEEGEIRVTLKRNREKTVCLMVYNKGKLIPENKMTKIWEGFYQVEESHVRMEEETRVGLGLYIVSLIAKAHHGTCDVQNECDGVTFSFTMEMI